MNVCENIQSLQYVKLRLPSRLPRGWERARRFTQRRLSHSIMRGMPIISCHDFGRSRRSVCGIPHLGSSAGSLNTCPNKVASLFFPPRYNQPALCPSYPPQTRSYTAPSPAKTNLRRKKLYESKRRRVPKPLATPLTSKSSRTRSFSGGTKKRLKFSYSGRVKVVSGRASRVMHIFNPT